MNSRVEKSTLSWTCIVRHRNSTNMEIDVKHTSSHIVLIVLCSFVLLLMFTVCSFGQEKTTPHRQDTAHVKQRKPIPNLLFEHPVQRLPLALELAPAPSFDLFFMGESPGSSAYFFSQRERESIDLAAPWKLQLARENKHKTLYTILGAVQAGGVAYLAYKQIEKYGWK
jgi:hypothetical protein